MIKIAALLGDYWHDEKDAKAGLEAAISRLPEHKEIDVAYITYEEAGQTLTSKPDLFINGKMDQLNPRDEQVETWLTKELDQLLTSYVENGGSVLAWHAGMAGYEPYTSYIEMLHGYFDFHPPGLQDVTYIWKEDNQEKRFPLKDEQYFVKIDQDKTEVDLWSTGVDGDSIAGWKHRYGQGKVCCFTPAHTKEAMLDENISRLLAGKITWLLAD